MTDAVGPPVDSGRLVHRRFHPTVELETGRPSRLEESDFTEPWEKAWRMTRLA